MHPLLNISFVLFLRMVAVMPALIFGCINDLFAPNSGPLSLTSLFLFTLCDILDKITQTESPAPQQSPIDLFHCIMWIFVRVKMCHLSVNRAKSYRVVKSVCSVLDWWKV